MIGGMTRLTMAMGCAMVSGLLVLPAGAEGPAMPVNGAVPKVTSHSVEYCDKLAARINALVFEARVAPPSNVIELSDEGQRMCASGQVRGGIMRLRKTLMAMQEIAESQ